VENSNFLINNVAPISDTIDPVLLQKSQSGGFCCKKSGYFTKQVKTSQMGYLYAINRSIMIKKAIVVA
jgi:hypothetical protein